MFDEHLYGPDFDLAFNKRVDEIDAEFEAIQEKRDSGFYDYSAWKFDELVHKICHCICDCIDSAELSSAQDVRLLTLCIQLLAEQPRSQAPTRLPGAPFDEELGEEEP